MNRTSPAIWSAPRHWLGLLDGARARNKTSRTPMMRSDQTQKATREGDAKHCDRAGPAWTDRLNGGSRLSPG